MPMDSVKTVLARVNAELVQLRRSLGHNHDDTEFWCALEMTVAGAQWKRGVLRQLANCCTSISHGARPIHGTLFATRGAASLACVARNAAVPRCSNPARRATSRRCVWRRRMIGNGRVRRIVRQSCE
jgi:hypothetical protein